MAKDSQRLEQEFIATLPAKTGHDLAAWMDIVKQSGLDKNNAILNWLKQTHQMNHAQANFLTGIYLNNGQPVFDYAVLFEELFEGKANLLPTYRALENLIQSNMPDVELIPTKAYISIEARKIFACATPMKQLMRIGVDLGDTPFDDVVQKAKGLGAMPNLTHMIEIGAPGDVDSGLLGHLQHAYQRTHRK